MKQFLPAFLLGILLVSQVSAQPLCTSTCHGVLGDNIYPNGDFGSGLSNIVQVNPGLAPGYLYQTNPPPNDGYYTLTNNTTPWGLFANQFWINIEDHGPEPNGYMMVVNASYAPGLFFKQAVPVCENTLYEFSADVINLFQFNTPPSILPNLTFLVDNVVYCETGDIPVDQQWHTARFSFTTAPGQTSVLLSMQNNAPGGFGNDLAIDNLSFRACGPEILAPPVVRYCQGTPAQLTSQLIYSPYDTVVYQWQVLTNGIWENIPGAITSPWSLAQPQDSGYYRLLMASALANLDRPNCRTASAAMQLLQSPGLQLQSTPKDVSCFGASDAQIDVQPVGGLAPFSFTWSNGAAGGHLAGLGAGLYTVTVADAVGCTGVASLALTEPAAILPGLQLAGQVSCFGGNDAAVAALVTGGSPPYGYVWSNGTTTDTTTGLSAGNYAITVTDTHGCTQTAVITVPEPPALQLSALATDVFCFGGNNGSVTAQATGGTGNIDFLWNNGATSASLTGFPAGAYSLTATDAAGCTQATSISIQEPTALQLTDSLTNISCFGGSDGQLQTGISGGTAPYVYHWNNGASQAQLLGLPAGMYHLTVTDALGCSVETSSVLTEPPALSASLNLLESISCHGAADAAIAASAQGGTPPFQWLWNTGASVDILPGIPANTYSLTATDAHGCTQTASLFVDEPPALEAVIASTDLSCFGANDGEFNVQVSGGTAPYAYQWNNGSVQAHSSDLPAGNYDLTVTDAHDCPVYATTSIYQPDSLFLTATAEPATCFAGQNGQAGIAILGGTGPYTILWNNGQTTAQMTGLPAGSYQATVTDHNGCLAQAQAQVGEPPQMTLLTSSDLVLCYGTSTGSAWVQSVSGQAPHQFVWNTGATGQQLTSVAAGQYGVTVTDLNGCTATGTATVQQPPALALSADVTDVLCAGGADGALTAMATGGSSPYHFWLNNGQNGATLEDMGAGNYTLFVADANGCTDSVAVWIQEPTPLTGLLTHQSVTCAGVSDGSAVLQLNGGTGPYQFHWNTGQSSGTLQQLPAGNYLVTATDAHGCTLTNAVLIAEPPVLTSQTMALDADCYGSATGTARVEASGGTAPYSFLWQTGATTQQVQQLQSGTYGVTTTDAHGCHNNAQVWVGEPPLLQITAAALPASCPEIEDGRVSAHASGGTGPYLYSWSNGQTSADIQHLATGAYTVTVTDGQGCSAAATATVWEAIQPSVSLGLDQTINLGEEIILTAHSNITPGNIEDYTWSGDGGSAQCPDCFQYRFVPTAAGCEAVLIRSLQGCQATDEVCFKVHKPRNIYVPNVFTPDDSGKNDYFTIYSDASVDRIRSLKVFSRWGEEVFAAADIPTNHEPSGWDGLFRGKPMNPGVFAWVAEVLFIDGEVVLLKGDVTLVR